MSLKNKLILIVVIPVVIAVITGIIVSSIRIWNQGIDGLEQKSEAILSRMESVRKFVANQGFLDDKIASVILKNPEGDLSETQKDEILNLVPIVASWKVGQENSDIDDYEFKVSSINARNSDHEATNEEAEFIKQLENEDVNTISYIDSKTNSLKIMRPVYLSESQGCLKCHGEPETSPFKNGKDILGYQMENYKDGEIRGMFMIVSDMKPVKREVFSAILLISLIGIVIGAISIFIGISIVNKIFSTINNIKNIAKDVSGGDLTKHIDINSNDELSDLSISINQMVESLNDILIQVNESSEILAQATLEISDSSNQISQNAQLQAAQFEQLSSSVQNTTSSAVSANEITNKSSQNAVKVNDSMRKLVFSINEIAESSQKIEEVIKIITDISFQTNILSLNASVEAARAGEAGRGFSVVAQEVKKLSDKSSVFAKQISENIKSTMVKIGDGVKITKQTNILINQIIEDVNKTADELQVISHASQEQTAAMDSTNSITTNNAASAQELAASASSLAEHAENLKNIVLNFKLKH